MLHTKSDPHHIPGGSDSDSDNDGPTDGGSHSDPHHIHE